MCQRITCSSCGKPSYTGCGRHVEQVLGDVPAERRCGCREQKSEAPTTPEDSWFKRLFGTSPS